MARVLMSLVVLVGHGSNIAAEMIASKSFSSPSLLPIRSQGVSAGKQEVPIWHDTEPLGCVGRRWVLFSNDSTFCIRRTQ